jgi:hypothetical protein
VVGTVKKSIETRSRTWLVRNVRQVCDGAVRRFGITLETVRSATSIPSFKSSPWILGAPHRGFASAIRLTRAQDGIGRHDHEGRSPPRPHSGQANPEEPLAAAQFRPARRSLVHGELLAEGEVLESELAVAAVEEWAGVEAGGAAR